MKRIVLSLAVVCLLATSCSKETISRLNDNFGNNSGDDHGGGSGSGKGTRIGVSEVPAAVINAYENKYPSATAAEWKKLDTGNYKVQFFVDAAKFETTFTPSGDILKEERDN